MTRTYRPLLLPLAIALLSHVVGCSGSDAESSSDGATGTSSSSSGGSATTGGGSATTGGGTTATSGGGTTTTSGGGTTEKFSFFVTSLVAMQDLSGSQDGFGGDFRFGETGPGAGLRGADKICATIAERSLPGAGGKTWRAFLSAVAGEDGNQVNAIDRIGEGPWYDRLLRLGVGQREHHRVLRHGGDVVPGQDPRRGDADEDVGALDRAAQVAAVPLAVGVLGDPPQRLVEVVAAEVHGP
ncbi:MAG TPA: hypothetical protein VL242_37090, partial [Sorangium sp.]|nr:hypothetical protein [Sorangium sp.]